MMHDSPVMRAPAISPAAVGNIPASGRELFWAGLAIAGGLALLTLASGASTLIPGYFRQDEICTWLLATDPSLPHALDALRHGADTNLPALYLILRGLHAIGVPLNETSLHLFAGAAAACGLLGCYALLRRVFDRMTSGAAIVALLAGDLLIKNMFEARFYDPWFAICAWFCLALALRRAGAGRLAAGAIAVLAPLMLLIHYFGVLTFLLIVPADFLADMRPLRVRLRNRWPLLTSLPALAVAPYFYIHQRATFTVWKTWIEPPTFSHVLNFLRPTLFFWMFLTLGAALTAAWLARKRLPVWRNDPLPDLRPLAGLLSLALLPAVVVVFSIVVQPALVPRYALPGAAGLAVLAALALTRLRPAAVMVLAGGWIIVGGVVLHGYAGEMNRKADAQATLYRLIAQAPADERIVFESAHNLSQLIVNAPQFKDRAFLLDFADGEDPDSVLAPSPASSYVVRDEFRVVANAYPAFRLITHSALAGGKPFLLVAADENSQRVQRRFHATAVRHIVGRVFEVTVE